MAGRFPLYADADVHGPLVEALIRGGWEVVRAVDRFPEGERDETHFGCAARENRVLVSNDHDQLAEAQRWVTEGRDFRGLVWWSKVTERRRMTVGRFLEAFEELARRADDPFAGYPIVYLRPEE